MPIALYLSASMSVAGCSSRSTPHPCSRCDRLGSSVTYVDLDADQLARERHLEGRQDVALVELRRIALAGHRSRGQRRQAVVDRPRDRLTLRQRQVRKSVSRQLLHAALAAARAHGAEVRVACRSSPARCCSGCWCWCRSVHLGQELRGVGQLHDRVDAASPAGRRLCQIRVCCRSTPCIRLSSRPGDRGVAEFWTARARVQVDLQRGYSTMAAGSLCVTPVGSIDASARRAGGQQHHQHSRVAHRQNPIFVLITSLLSHRWTRTPCARCRSQTSSAGMRNDVHHAARPRHQFTVASKRLPICCRFQADQRATRDCGPDPGMCCTCTSRRRRSRRRPDRPGVMRVKRRTATEDPEREDAVLVAEALASTLMHCVVGDAQSAVASAGAGRRVDVGQRGSSPSRSPVVLAERICSNSSRDRELDRDARGHLILEVLRAGHEVR